MRYNEKGRDKLKATQEGYAGNLLVWPYIGCFVTVHNCFGEDALDRV